MQADAEASQLHADVRRVLSAVEGFQKTVMIRQDGEIGALRERLREMEARSKAAQPTFVGRSGTTY
jgi:polyhydroxyalkanoate synthesis regulator phasin